MKYILLACVLLVSPMHLFAQDFVTTPFNEIAIRSEPQFPTPETNVVLTLVGDIPTGSIVEWYQDGKKIAHGVNLKQITLLSPSRSVKSTVETSVGGVPIASILITSGSVTIVWNALSYIPPFFKGGAITNGNTAVEAIAVSELYETKPPHDVNSLYFTWSVNGVSVPSLSGYGASRILIPPRVGGIRSLSVHVSTPDGHGAFSESYVAESQTMPLLYYEHPLWGVQYHQPLRRLDAIQGNDARLVTIPFYASATTLDALRFAWKINGNDANVDTRKQNVLQLTSDAGGLASLEVTITNVYSVLEEFVKTWSIQLGSKTPNAL